MSKNIKGNLFLLIAAFFWGSTFVAQELAAQYYHLGSFTYQSTRMFVGALVLVPMIFIMTHQAKKKGTYKKPTKKDNKTLIIAGVICGTILCVAACLQQFAIEDPNTNSGKIAFITAMYILIVPIIYFFFGNKIRLRVIVAALIGAVGLYFLSVKADSFSISHGDFLGMLCALGFSAHILVIDYFGPKVDGVKLSAIQFFVCGVEALIPTILIEKPAITDILSCWGPILYAGVFSCGIAYTFQILGQQNTNPTIASIIMSLESVFSVLTGLVILGYSLSAREVIGCVVIFTAIIISQLPGFKKSSNPRKTA